MVTIKSTDYLKDSINISELKSSLQGGKSLGYSKSKFWGRITAEEADGRKKDVLADIVSRCQNIEMELENIEQALIREIKILKSELAELHQALQGRDSEYVAEITKTRELLEEYNSRLTEIIRIVKENDGGNKSFLGRILGSK